MFFPFEPEVPYQSLKLMPIWNELEQLLDNPYATLGGAVCTDAAGAIPGNDTGTGQVYPTYCTNDTILRRSLAAPGTTLFGVTLPRLTTHPLNYNPSMIEEMRLINILYPGGDYDVSNICYQNPPDVSPFPALLPACTGPSNDQVPVNMSTISPGADRVASGDSAIDNNATFAPQTRRGAGVVCVASPEPTPLGSAGVVVCGGDPGEPGYQGFGVLNLGAYSTPAVPGVTNPSTVLSSATPLFDADRAAAPSGVGGSIPARNAAGQFGLRKPSLRIWEISNSGNGHSPTNPNYAWNSDAQLAARGAAAGAPADQAAAFLAPSTENDYVRNRLQAMRLGKALFWDMQVGSDSVQSCGSCHFHAGADNRTKNQMNPNHIGFPPDVTFQLRQPNEEVVASDFPLHKLADPEIAGDPACTTPIVANVTWALENPKPASVTVCDAANILSDTNDVVSSMGVFFGKFTDIPAVGTLTPTTATNPVASVPPDLRSALLADNTDVIPGFAGTDGTGHQFRRVEPRNTPTLFLAASNFDNFWDGRARHDFNGGSVFGASDPQSHVWVCTRVNAAGNNCTGGPQNFVATRQIIKFSSLASLATGPGLSEFEMSRAGRNWAKVAKKLLQLSAATGLPATTPLANQLVATDDSILGPYSNQGGSLCGSLAPADRSPGTPAPGKPGLCISYQGLIRAAFYPALWANGNSHLNGCYTDGRTDIHPNQCAGLSQIPVLDHPSPGVDVLNITNTADPFDGYRLTQANGAADRTNTNQFTQMEANFSLFWGLSIHLWSTILVPDDTPFDQFLDRNPDAHMAIGEAGEILLTPDLANCPGGVPGRGCFSEWGNFKRDPNVQACTEILTAGGVPVQPRTCAPGATVPAGGTRQPGAPDPLLGADLFVGSNLSLKNPNFRSARCGECHAMPTLTDHTMPFTMKAQLPDLITEFVGIPTQERIAEPLGRSRVISGFLLEDEINSNGQDGVERRLVNQSIVPHDGSIYPALAGMSFPDGLSNPNKGYAGAGGAIFDNGVYNLGVTPCVADQIQVTGRCDDNGRGNIDAFGWPMSLATLMLKNLGGPGQQPGTPVPDFDPTACDPGNPSENSCLANPATGVLTNYTGGLWEISAQDQQINPGTEGDDVINPKLPPYLYPWANAIGVGDLHPVQDEAGGPPNGMVNTVQNLANNEGFTPAPFIPASLIVETTNSADSPLLGTWPMANRIGRFGSIKAAQLREVSLTGPYFHNGGKLTLRQVVDFYTRGGDFPVTNAAHRDFNIINLNLDVESNLSDAEKAAIVDFLLELTDARVRYERAPFDHPEVFVPLDGTAPENTFGRAGFLAQSSSNPAAPAICSDPATVGPGLTPVAIPGATGHCFRQVPAVGAGGSATPLPNFLGICDRPGQNFDGTACSSPISHHSH